MATASRSEIRAALSGPISSLRTPFTRTGDIDYEGFGALIDANLSGGSNCALLTWGDSLFSLLSDGEIGELTAFVARHVGRRALVVAADGTWWTRQAVAFARHCRDVGAQVVMVKPPAWTAPTVETLVSHYRAIADELPVMLVTNVFAGAAATGLQTVARLIDEVPNVVAVKDDLGGEFARKLAAMCGERLAMFSGGQKQNHLAVAAYGAVGFMSTFVGFCPQVTRAYWQAVTSGDWAAAQQVVRDHEWPLFDHLGGLPGGFDSGIHAVTELAGLAQRWRRPPAYNLSDAEMEALRALCTEHGWL